jgi:branched-chain amino acid transport system substrate-binding protein
MQLRFPRLMILPCVLAALALGLAACGGDDDEGGGGGGGGETAQEGGGGNVTVYSSLPLQGAQREQSLAVVNGAKLALKQAGNKAGNFNVEYKSLDDSTAQAANWTPEATSANARKACQDDTARAYIGEFNSGASAISLPILNECQLAQISPSNTAVGLTSDEPGADRGEPEKYYPTGQRHYVRIAPKDTIQGAALATVMKEDGCTKVFMTNDKEVYGAGLSRNIESSAKEQGIDVLANEGIDPKAPNYRSLAQRAKSRGADCFVFSGTTPNNAVQIFKDFEAAGVEKLYGPDGVAEPSFTKKGEGIPPKVAAKTKVTVATLSPDAYPPEGQEFFQQYSETYGEKNPPPYAIYGYESMRLVLDAIERSSSGERADVIKALFDTKDRESVIGNYSIDENGDVTLTTYGVYTIKDGELEFDKSVEGEPAAGGASE